MSVATIVIATTKSGNIDRAPRFRRACEPGFDVELNTDKQCFIIGNLRQLQTDWIFFPHWSWIILDETIHAWRSAILHTRPVPYGRGGSSVRNVARSSEVSTIKRSPEAFSGLRHMVD